MVREMPGKLDAFKMAHTIACISKDLISDKNFDFSHSLTQVCNREITVVTILIGFFFSRTIVKEYSTVDNFYRSPSVLVYWVRLSITRVGVR